MDFGIANTAVPVADKKPKMLTTKPTSAKMLKFSRFFGFQLLLISLLHFSPLQ